MIIMKFMKQQKKIYLKLGKNNNNHIKIGDEYILEVGNYKEY